MRKLTIAVAASLMASAVAYAGNGIAPRSVECIAAFELMDRAAPNWTQQSSVQVAWQGWEIEAVRLTRRTNVDFGTQINREMTALADRTSSDPNTLSRRAVQYVADAPAL